ncbi:transcription factor LBX2-like [Ostrea edulis]|uniref:transcription factor LBX2-like n=1 Tax=Ostrea edulis TaxID=37623 RepID=UPI002095584D|nr:transcription factor LBX2-like [Ostrea edulis]
MLLKSKVKKASFSIEFLSRSSHDEKKGDEQLQNPAPSNSPDNAVMNPINRLGHSGTPFYTPEKLSISASVSPPKTPGINSPLSLPSTSSTNSSVKRKREDSCDSGVESPSPDRFRRISEASISSNSSCVSDQDDSDELQKRKKARTAFSTVQVEDLEKRYQLQKYLPANERQALAEKLGLSDQQVKTWFQNRRMKEKRQKRDDEHARTFSLPTGGVDVSQLTALGLPCPPPYNTSAPNFGQLPGSTHIQPKYPMTSPLGHFPSVLPYTAQFPVSQSYVQGRSYTMLAPYLTFSSNVPSPQLGQIAHAPEKSGV